MIDVPESWRSSAIPEEIVGYRPQGGGFMRAFAIYVAAGLILGVLIVAALSLLGLMSVR
jgi:hypothetical protein